MPDHPLIEYRDIPGFPGYCVGSDGSVRSCIHQKGLGHGMGTASYIGVMWRKLSTSIEKKSGYVCVKLYKNGRTYHHRVHGLVLRAFVGPRPKGMMCCHSDDNPENNSISNLRWGTQASNSHDAVRNNRSTSGSRNPRAKLTEADVAEIRRRRASGEPAKSIAADFGVTYWHIHAINAGQFWRE